MLFVVENYIPPDILESTGESSRRHARWWLEQFQADKLYLEDPAPEVVNEAFDEADLTRPNLIRDQSLHAYSITAFVVPIAYSEGQRGIQISRQQNASETAVSLQL